MKRALLCSAGLIVALCVAPGAEPRFTQFTREFQHPKDRAEIITSTFLGGPGTEWLAGGGFQPDGTVVVAGVSLGPALSLETPEVVLGKDGPIQAPVRRQLFRSGRPELDKQGQPRFETLAWNHPNATAFIARLSPDTKTLKSVTRFPWKSGGVTSAAVDGEGNILLCGPAGSGIDTISDDIVRAASVATNARPHASAAARGPRGGESESPMGYETAYIAKLAPDGSKVLWVRTISGFGTVAPVLKLGAGGKIHLHAADARVFDGTGKQLSASIVPGLEGHGAMNAVDGTYARGGEHHWPTGREPYRDPMLNIYRPDGTLLYELYNWDGPLVGLNELRLVSDSAIRGVAFADDGKLLVHAWSDGGNSVLYREPNDVFTSSKKMRGLGLTAWGAGVLSCAYLIKIDTATCKVDSGTLWVGYLKDRDKPNSVTVNSMGVARDGSVCVAGSAAWGLIQTGNAFPGEPNGNYVAVMSQDFTSLRFSSVLPATGQTEVADTTRWAFATGTVNGKPMAMVLSGAIEREGERVAPTLKARQDKYGGGLTDGHILLLDLSPSAKD